MSPAADVAHASRRWYSDAQVSSLSLLQTPVMSKQEAALLLLCALLLPCSLVRAAGGCGPGGAAPGGGAPYACTSTASELPAGVRLFYTVDAAAGMLRLALQTPGRGWVALAFTTAANAGIMAPAHAYIGRLSAGGAGEARALALRAALYGGDMGSGAAPLEGTAVEPLEASVHRDANGTTLRFARRMGAAGLPAGAVAVELEGSAGAGVCYLNWAYGPSDELVYHGPANRGSFEQELRSAASEAADASAAAAAPAASRARRSPTLPASRLRTHGRLMLIAWAGLLPAGAVLGRLVQRLRPYSLYAHVAVQASGLAVATVSFALIVAALRDVVRFDDPERIPYAHGKVGVAAMVVLWAQPLNALARPHPGVSRRRRAWEFLHALLGRCAIILGIVNIFSGVYILGRELRLIPFDTWAGWAAASLGVIWLAGAAIQKAMDQSERNRQQQAGHINHDEERPKTSRHEREP